MPTPSLPASVNGIALHAASELPDTTTLRQRACLELLRQAAVARGLLSGLDQAPLDGILSEDASSAIEALVSQEVTVPHPDEASCRRHFQHRPEQFVQGEAVQLRHILFAVTPGVNLMALRGRAKAALQTLHLAAKPDTFASMAGTLSNCPSGVQGGDLGWLQAHDCAPEFAAKVFGQCSTGLLPQLVQSRFGLHIVDVISRKPGANPDFDSVQSAVSLDLQRQSFATGLRQYLAILAGAAILHGVDIEGANSPLVQ